MITEWPDGLTLPKSEIAVGPDNGDTEGATAAPTVAGAGDDLDTDMLIEETEFEMVGWFG